MKPSNNNHDEFEVHHLESELQINTYRDIIEKYFDNNPYYSFDYFASHMTINNSIIVFELKKGEESLIIMPMVKRKIGNTSYFDVISPYGYSGPLFKGAHNSILAIKFWDFVDNWYKRNNIITEFVRFSLTKNYNGYSGKIFPTLENVKGTLMPNFEDQWNAFLPKVRNNYRKAQKFGLISSFLESNNIKKKHITMFYSIYVDTMRRNNAKKFLYFSLSYFTKLILENKNITLCLVYLEDNPISTEIIIKIKGSIYAFLGGTKAKYFDKRPNDFLRVEVIKWGIKNGERHYILGGGIKNNDGLYKSKKALFPKDINEVFYTGRKIINTKIYKLLNENNQYKSIDTESEENDFFPAYRKNQQE